MSKVSDLTSGEWLPVKPGSRFCCTIVMQPLDRRWGVRLEYVGVGYVLHIGVVPWAMRVIVLGVSLWFGKILPRGKVSETIEIPDLLNSKRGG